MNGGTQLADAGALLSRGNYSAPNNLAVRPSAPVRQAANHPCTPPTHYLAFRAVQAQNDREALENFARFEQFKRDAFAEAQFPLYRLGSSTPRAVVKIKDGVVYDCLVEADGTVTYPFVPDQTFCDMVNRELRRLRSCVRLTTKHFLIRYRLEEAARRGDLR